MTEPKTKVLYDRKNPFDPWVTHVAIQTETKPPYVWGAYQARTDQEALLPIYRMSDMLVIRAEQAQRLFDFQKGNIEDVVQQEKKGE